MNLLPEGKKVDKQGPRSARQRRGASGGSFSRARAKSHAPASFRETVMRASFGDASGVSARVERKSAFKPKSELAFNEPFARREKG